MTSVGSLRSNLAKSGGRSNRALTPWVAVLLVTVTGCATGGGAPKDDPQFARSIADTAARAAVAKPGARVCRELQVGIAERDWVSGVVVAAEGATVSVRVDDPGRYPHTLNGIEAKKGTLIRDNPAAWIPCLEVSPKSG